MGKHVLPKRPFFSISILQWRIYRAEPTNDWQDRRNIEKVPIQRSAFSSLPIIQKSPIPAKKRRIGEITSKRRL